MSTRYESPGHDVDRLQRQLNELFARSGTARTTAEFPPINIWTNADGAVLTAELPGLDLSQVAISVLGDTLTIKGERAEPKTEEGRTFHRVERGFGAFARTIQLAFRIDPSNVTATYKRGLLEVTVPKADADRVRSISITTG